MKQYICVDTTVHVRACMQQDIQTVAQTNLYVPDDKHLCRIFTMSVSVPLISTVAKNRYNSTCLASMLDLDNPSA